MAVKADLEQINGTCKTEISKTPPQIIIGLSSRLAGSVGWVSPLSLTLGYVSAWGSVQERGEGEGGVTPCDTPDLI